MDLRMSLRLVLALLGAATAAVAPASAQVFGDDFANTSPGTYWQSVSGNPALAITETAGRLQYSSTQSSSVAAMAFAGYASANWRIRTTSEFRARVTLRSALVGTGVSAGSEVGVGINLHRFGATPALNQLRPGIAAWLGTRRFDAGAFRTLVVAETSASGAPMPLMRLWAPTSNQTAFYDVSTGSFVRAIGTETILYVRYDPLEDALYLSTTGYLDPDAYEYLDFMGSQLVPVQFSIGGFGQQPGNLTGNDTWLDTFRVDSGVVESAPTNVVATDGTSTSVVRVTWTAGMNATGYQVLRTVSGGAAQLVGTVLPTVTVFDDATAAPLQQYTYTIRSMGPSGPGFDASDVGWRGLPAPMAVVASDGTSIAGVALSWGALANVEGYRVFRAIGAGSPTEVGAPSTNSYIDTSADAGIVYSYTVKARGATGDGPASAADTGWRNVAAPAGVSATDGTSTANVTVTWTAVPGAAGHKVFRATGTAAATLVATLGATAATYADTTAVAGTVYTYTVKATTAAGESAVSAANTGWRNVAAPAGLAATDGTFADKVRVTWTAHASTLVTGYRVLRRLPSESAFTMIATVTGRTTVTYNDTTIPVAITGTYAIQAVMAAGATASSATDTGFRSGTPSGAPPAGGMPPPGGEGGTASNEPPSTGMTPPAGGAGDGSGSGGGDAVDGVGEAGGGVGAGGEPDSHPDDDAANVACDELADRIAALIAAARGEDGSIEQGKLRDLLEPAPQRIAGQRPHSTMSAACAILDGDANLDGRIDAADALLFAEAWCTGDRIIADVDRDGSITERDLDATLRALMRHGVGDAREHQPEAR